MSAAAKYEPIAQSEAEETLDFYCNFCKKNNCDHWKVYDLEIKTSAAALWGLIEPTRTIKCKILCVKCDKIAHCGKVDDYIVICLRCSAHSMIIHQKPTKPTKTPVAATLVAAKPVAAKPDTIAAKPVADVKTVVVPNKEVAFRHETITCGQCWANFTVNGSCEHWATNKNPKEEHYDVWCLTCDPKCEKLPLHVAARSKMSFQACQMCKNRIGVGTQALAYNHAWSDKDLRPDCKKCRGDGWVVAPKYGVCPACAGTGGLACACAKGSSGACACIGGYKERCRVCEGQRAIKIFSAAGVRCPFCREN